jgi:hypothetical protein
MHQWIPRIIYRSFFVLVTDGSSEKNGITGILPEDQNLREDFDSCGRISGAFRRMNILVIRVTATYPSPTKVSVVKDLFFQ